jgi:2-polyprenyl-3-methyl-5-hydroxy-6-metoxy-1,4-benzoquinol methylase
VDDTTRVARRAFRTAGARTRAHVQLRALSAPLAGVEALLPRRGALLDVGCGHGLLTLAAVLRQPGRRVVGVDVDEAKLLAGRRAAELLGVADRVTFELVEPDWLPEGTFDGVVSVDVLYLLGRERALRLVEAMAGAVRPGGTVVVKEMADDPAWKVRLDRGQELVATRLARYTMGSTSELVPLELVREVLASADVASQVLRLDRGRLHPHAAVAGVRISSGPAVDVSSPPPPHWTGSRRGS